MKKLYELKNYQKKKQNIMKKLITKLVMLLIALTMSTNLMAGTYSGGTGVDADNAYLISNTDDLIELSTTSADWGAYFKQTANIAFDANEQNVDWDGDETATWDAGDQLGFSPIGNLSPYFTGSYDGDNHYIDNIYINRPSQDYIGLFGLVYINESTKEIYDLGVCNVNITGDAQVGGLVGYNLSSTVRNSYSTGSVSGSGHEVGGLVGNNRTSIVSNCYSTGSVSGSSNEVGGLVGSNAYSSTVSNCYSTGSVSGSSNEVGGLVGKNAYSSTVSNSYSTGSVSGSNYVGGLVGYNSSTVSNSYSTGSVTRSSGTNTSFGGFCGINTNTIEYCYSIGDVFSSPDIAWNEGGNADKGFVGGSSGDYTSNFWDSEASNQDDDSPEATANYTATGKTTAEMKTQGTFTSWDFVGTWSIDGSTNDGYPFVQNNVPPIQIITWDGSAGSDWNTAGNWDGNAIPSAIANVVIANAGTAPVISSGVQADCNNLTIESGATLTIQSTSDGTGSLIVEGTASGNITVERYLTEGVWHYISAPVNDTRVFDDFLGLIEGANNDQFYWWDEDGTDNDYTGIWFDILNSPTGISYTDNSFLHSQGYAITYAGSGSETINFSGVPYTENKTISITKTDASTNPGANLVGNPFTSTIAINDNARIGDGDDANNYFIYQNASLLAVDYQAIYLWDESQSDYVAKNNGIGATFIAPGQGFMVVGKNASSSLAFNKNTRKHGAAPFYKNGNDNQHVELLVVDTENNKNSTIITFIPDMTLGLDPSYDAAKLKGNPDIALYTKLVEDTGVDFAIQALPPLNTEKLEVKIGLDVSKTGNYTFKIKELENFDENITIKIEDKETGNLVDFREIEEYSFNINEPGQIRERFVLHFNDASGIEDQTPETENIRFYVYDNKLYIIDKELKNGTIQLFNVLGQPVMEKRYSKSVNTIDLNQATGYYVVRIITEKSFVCGKVYVE